VSIQQKETDEISGQGHCPYDSHGFNGRHNGKNHLVHGLYKHAKSKQQHEDAFRQSGPCLPARRLRKYKKAEPIDQGIAKHIQCIRLKRSRFCYNASDTLNNEHCRIDNQHHPKHAAM